MINTKYDNILPISNPTGEQIYNGISRVENMLVVRDLNNLIFFNCTTLKVEYFVRVPFEDYVLQDLMSVRREEKDLVVCTSETENEKNMLKEIRVKDFFYY